MQGRDLLILVDYERSKPNFYILNIDDWKRVAENHIKLNIEKGSIEKNEVSFDPPDYIPVWENQLMKNGKPYSGASLEAKEVGEYKGSWDKIIQLLN